LCKAGAKRGDIPSDVDLEGAVTMLMIMADGLWWRRALDPQFKPETALPLFLNVARFLLRGDNQNERAAAGTHK
jgi:TetR/AcrR family transcriptional repressor of uid operon